MSKNTYLKYFYIAFSIFILIGCKVKRPDDVIPESTMVDLLYDYHIAKAMSEDLNTNENYKKALYLDAVLNKYGTNQASFDSSMVWYTRNADVLSKVYEKVTEKFKAKQTNINQLIAIRDKKPQTSQPGDSIDVWAWNKMLYLTNIPLYNSYAFVLPIDSNFKERDEFVWQARFNRSNAHQDDSLLYPVMAMQVVYYNDSVIGKTINITNNGRQEIRIQSDSLGKILEIKGFIYNPIELNNSALLIDSISLMRYHSKDTTGVANDSIRSESTKVENKKEPIEQEATTPTIRPVNHSPLNITPRKPTENVANDELKLKTEN